LAEEDWVLIEGGFSTGFRSSGGQRDPPHANDFRNEPSWRMVMKRGATTRGKARPKKQPTFSLPPPTSVSFLLGVGPEVDTGSGGERLAKSAPVGEERLQEMGVWGR